jgi:hypothetical protein
MIPGMSLIGDLERLFATSLYPNRIPIAIGVAILLVGLAVLARRRRWIDAARRHPRRTGALATAALAVALPLAWYLASPLFIRTELVEPLPVAVIDERPSVPASPGVEGASPSGDPAAFPSAPAAGPSSTPAPSPTPFQPTVRARGTFHGADDFHFGEGTASILETAPGVFALRFDGFSVRNGPDLYVYLSPNADGYADGALELGTLKATDGAFGYMLPPDADPGDFASAVIWCRQFAVLFAVAPLEGT